MYCVIYGKRTKGKYLLGRKNAKKVCYEVVYTLISASVHIMNLPLSVQIKLWQICK
jgi:hypothetical protein